MDDLNKEAWEKYRSGYSSRDAWDAKAAQRLADETAWLNLTGKPFRETYAHRFITIVVCTFAGLMAAAKLVWLVL